MKKINSLLVNFILLFSISLFSGCLDLKPDIVESVKANSVNPDYFILDNLTEKIQQQTVKLSGIETLCYVLKSNSQASEHKMGPWCPRQLEDKKEKGGIWFKDGKVYDVSGHFIAELAEFYKDDKWKLFNEEGFVKITESKEACLGAAKPDVEEKYQNHCVECLPEYVRDLSKTFVFPLNPVLLVDPIILNRPPPKEGEKGGDRPKERPKGPPPGKKGGGGPAMRGIALNGVAYDAPAPLHLILGGYTIPPLDPAGGHINMDAGYHYHAATGLSVELKQADGHAPLLGYAMDGIGLYAYKNADGTIPNDLDECRGHFDEVRGYHYHVDAAGNNNFINCLSGAIATNE